MNKLLFIYLFGILAAENNKELALNHFMQGEFLMNQGNYAMAILEFQDAIELDPNASTIHVSIADGYRRIGKLSKAEDHLGIALELDSEEKEALEMLGQIFLSQKRYLEAKKTYQELSDLDFDKVFIGSCTNSRIEDLREAAEVLKGQKVSENIQEAIVVPGSGMVKEQAEKEGIHKIFIDAGFQWRAPGCSMCLGMNPDQLSPYERCASTSNRNFEGRQGNLGRTHLMSPKMAALTAINGRIVKEI